MAIPRFLAFYLSRWISLLMSLGCSARRNNRLSPTVLHFGLALGAVASDNGSRRDSLLVKQADLLQQIEELKDKLNRAQRQVSGLRQKSKYLEVQSDDARNREGNTNDLVMELLERQRELNVMLNRANIMLNRTQEAMALSSMELNEMAKALPEPKKAEWVDRVARVNDLFKQTGVQDAELGALESVNPKPAAAAFDASEMKRESEEAFGRKQSIWERKERHEPPRVHAEVVEEEEPPAPPRESIRLVGEDTHPSVDEPPIDATNADEAPEQSEEDALLFPPRRKSWWRKLA